MVKISQS